MQALDALLNRVSVPRLLEPAPTQEQRDVLFAAAMRAPDHGQLRPWRFLTVEGAAVERLVEANICLFAALSALVELPLTDALSRNPPNRG